MEPYRRRSRRIGLVLGAGGTVGCAYHAGVLYSLWHHSGFDAREASAIVGTSAGAFVGALVASGLSPEALVELARHQAIVHGRGEGVAEPDALTLALAFRPPTPLGVWRGMRHGSLRPALLSMARHGRMDLRPHVEEHTVADPAAWQDGVLRVCAASEATGARRVLDAGCDASMATAVAASCAVPGLFAPQRIGREWLLDGGVHSVTNIDAMPFDRVDEVWVIAPMAGRVFRSGMTAVRRWIEARMRRELQRVPPEIPVRVFEPQREACEAMGTDLMATDRTDRTVLAGFLETGDALISAAA